MTAPKRTVFGDNSELGLARQAKVIKELREASLRIQAESWRAFLESQARLPEARRHPQVELPPSDPDETPSR